MEERVRGHDPQLKQLRSCPPAAILALLLLVLSPPLWSYRLPWNSVNSGGRPGAVPGYLLNGSVGQQVQGVGSATGLLGTWGFWYNLQAPSHEDVWSPGPNVPMGNRSKDVWDGGALAYVAMPSGIEHIYAFKGNKTCEFHRYNVASEDWSTLETIPVSRHPGDSVMVDRGAALVGISGTAAAVYAVKGDRSLEFWKYRPGTPSPWVRLKDVPRGGSVIQEGAGLAAVRIGDTTWIYLLKASGTREFYRYNTQRPNALWQTMADAPLGMSGQPFSSGCCLTSDGASTIYALKGKRNEFYAYDVVTNTWSTLENLPLRGRDTIPRLADDGDGLAYQDGTIYALKGGSTREFWGYTRSSGWVQEADMPPGGGMPVHFGGALVASPGRLFALKGNHTLEFWSYGPDIDSDGDIAGPSPSSQGSTANLLSGFSLSVTPNPAHGQATIAYSVPKSTAFSVKLHDVSGRQVALLAQGRASQGVSSMEFPASNLPRGIYMLRLETADQKLTRKLILN
jgi:hypothetical protein